MNKNRTVFWIIILIPLILVVPVNIVVIHNAQKEMQYLVEERTNESQSYIQSMGNNVERDLQTVEEYMQMLVTQGDECINLKRYSSTSQKGFWSESSKLGKTLKTFLATNSCVGGVIVYFSEADVIVSQSNFGAKEKKKNIDRMTEIVKSDTGSLQLGQSRNWIHYQVEGMDYLGVVTKDENVVCLATVSLNDILDSMKGSMDGESYFHYLSFNNRMLTKEGITEMPEIRDQATVFYKGSEYYDVSKIMLSGNLVLGRMLDKNSLTESTRRLTYPLLILSVLCCLVGPLISLTFIYFVERPLNTLTTTMDRIRNGDRQYRIQLRKKRIYSEFDDLNQDFNNLMDELEASQKALMQKELEEQRVELRYLSEQIRPHFILNALNIVYTYDDEEFPLARKMVLHLTKYFRYLVNLNSDYVYLYDEMEFVKTYLEIQKVRYPDRFVYFAEWEDEVGAAEIPAVVIQTFVENCIKYSIEKDKMLYIMIRAKKIGNDKLQLTIADTGKGFNENTLKDIRNFLHTREYSERLGVGIQNVVKRLHLLYGENYYVGIKNSESGGARVELVLPLIVEEKAVD
ncbi:MAG: histidine kinase [Blautia sp.]|nr:histidine kinase [Blautia sp.]